MKIKRVKNKIGFFIWAIIGFCLVMLLYKIGANAESVRVDVERTDLSGWRVTGGEIKVRADYCLVRFPVSSGTTYYCSQSSGFKYFCSGAFVKDKIVTSIDLSDSISFIPDSDGFILFQSNASGALTCPVGVVYYFVESGSTKTLTDISVNKTKTTYFVGEEFTTNDISVDALYSDLSSENVTNFVVDSSSVNINVAGTYQISVTYEGITKTIPIVYESIPVTLTSISAVKSKTNYYVGDTLNTNDFVVTGIWSDGIETVLSDYTVNISAVHMNTVGSYPITVSYEDKTTTVYITVNAVEGPPVEPPLGDLTTTNALLQKLDIDINNNLYEVRLLCGFNVALLIASIFLRRKS